MNPETTPPEALSGPAAACGAESKDLGVGATNGPQAATGAPDPHAVILDAISTALNGAGCWLPIEGKRAVADAVLAQAGRPLEAGPAEQCPTETRAMNPDRCIRPARHLGAHTDAYGMHWEQA